MQAIQERRKDLMMAQNCLDGLQSGIELTICVVLSKHTSKVSMHLMNVYDYFPTMQCYLNISVYPGCVILATPN